MKHLISLIFDPTGKINRLSFLIGNVLCWSMLFIPVFLSVEADNDYLQGDVVKNYYQSYFLPLITIGLYISAIIGFIFTKIKRFRDLNMSGLSIFLLFVPLLNIYYFFMLFLERGVVESNGNPPVN